MVAKNKLLLLLPLCIFQLGCSFVPDNKPIDRLVVYKSKHELHAYSGHKKVLKAPIALGFNPKEPKEREGDGRTPEGRYFIASRNPASKYYLSLHISYPNQQDIKYARQRGYSPGGQIMIHGIPNDPKWPEDDYLTKDWTNGCIAVSNEVIENIFERVVLNAPIDIYP